MTSFIDGLRMMTRWNKLWVESMFFVSSFSFHFVKQVFALLLYFSTFEQKKIIHNTICRWYLFPRSEGNSNSLQPIRLIRDEQRSLSVGYV